MNCPCSTKEAVSNAERWVKIRSHYKPNIYDADRMHKFLIEENLPWTIENLDLAFRRGKHER